jgi:hypothetical protein
VLLNWAGIPTAMSLYSFCFSGHAVFPMIYTGMSNRKMFPAVSKQEVLSLIFCVCLTRKRVLPLCSTLLICWKLKLILVCPSIMVNFSFHALSQSII